MESTDEKQILTIEEIEVKLEPCFTRLPIEFKLFCAFTSILIILPNVFVIFFMLKKESRTFLDNLNIYDCCLRKRIQETRIHCNIPVLENFWACVILKNTVIIWIRYKSLEGKVLGILLHLWQLFSTAYL